MALFPRTYQPQLIQRIWLQVGPNFIFLLRKWENGFLTCIGLIAAQSCGTKRPCCCCFFNRGRAPLRNKPCILFRSINDYIPGFLFRDHLHNISFLLLYKWLILTESNILRRIKFETTIYNYRQLCTSTTATEG